MDIRTLTPTCAGSPQIMPEALPAIKTAGHTSIIDNRPGRDVPPMLLISVMQAVAQAPRLTFLANPLK